jgi:putative thiamine transport system substrate-binding protein
MKRLLAAATFAAAAFALPATADPDPKDWDALTEAARGQTVYFNAWGGSPNINAYIEWAAGELDTRYGIELVHVKLDDTANAVAGSAKAAAANVAAARRRFITGLSHHRPVSSAVD